ncbi:hotdog fold domain-containing protein [Ornithinimicrobium sp. Y1694]|uniref:hotdog fold domain-containing protein n=1 Tax=Ornithinimicrobium sp. Y1694 TaxID=3418590 RepID=UPI003CF7E068
MTSSPAAKAYAALRDKPLGKALFSAAVSLRAPYFRTILPVIVSLEPGRGEARMRDWWGVRNHIGTVHAIASCNLAEFVGGLTTDVSVPATHRWIPRGMTVTYLAKARGTLTGVATVEDLSGLGAEESREVVVPVAITDRDGTEVVRADITMWVAPRGPATQPVPGQDEGRATPRTSDQSAGR